MKRACKTNSKESLSESSKGIQKSAQEEIKKRRDFKSGPKRTVKRKKIQAASRESLKKGSRKGSRANSKERIQERDQE